MDLRDFQNLPLRGGFLLLNVNIISEPMVDAMGRAALARTSIIGSTLQIDICGSLPDSHAISISLYHEILEGAAVAAPLPPAAVCEMNEGDFEKAAIDSHRRFGKATPITVNQMLESFGF